MANRESELARYRDRMIAVEQERRDRSEDLREITVEMKSAGLEKHEIAGVKLAVRRHFEDGEKRQRRESAEEIAAALGSLADTPLGEAATSSSGIDRARRVRRESARADVRARAAAAELDRLAREDGGVATLSMDGETIATFGEPRTA